MKTKQKSLLLVASALLASTAFAGNNEQGIDYYRAELYGAAKIFFLQQTGQNTADQAENYYYLGQTYYKLGQSDSAQYYYDKSIATDAEYPFGYIGNGTLTLEKGDFKQAEELFKKATGLAKKDPSVATSVAEAYVAQKKYTEAEEALKKARKINKEYSGLWITEGDMLLQQGKVGDATGKFDMAIRFNPNEKLAYLNCAKVYKTINPEQSLEYLQKSVDIDANYIPAYAEIGDINLKLGNDYKDANDTLQADECFEKALAAYEKFISIPGVPMLQQERYAQLLFFTRQYDKAEKQIEAVLAQDAENIVMHRIRAYNNFALDKDDVAIEQLTTLLSGLPEDKHLYLDHYLMGNSYIKQGNFKKAEESYKNAAKIDQQKEAELYAMLIVSADKAKDYLAAIDFYEHYFEITPDASTADFFNYGMDIYIVASTYATKDVAAEEKTDAQLKAQNETAFQTFFQKADKAFSSVIERKSDNYLGYFWKARLYALADAYDQVRDVQMKGLAKPHYETALPWLIKNNESGDRNTDIVETYRYLGNYYYTVEKKTDKLVECYQKILEYDPDNATAKNVLDQIRKNKAAAAEAAARKERGY
jgi:tetratricopeptide (TPR) repeat protein